MERELLIDNLNVKVFRTREEMGRNVAQEAVSRIRCLLQTQEEVNILFAAAPSQNELLLNLSEANDLDWGRINGFHMDEYIGLDINSPRSFGNYLKERIFSLKPFKEVYYMNRGLESSEELCFYYEQILKSHPLDVGFLGIGENGHLAFNDPHVAFFDDPQPIKVVDLDILCRMQQVHDGCFDRLEDVPLFAVTLTIPTLFDIPNLYCTVPGLSKSEAVKNCLYGPVSSDCPASILRRHGNATLYLDSESSSLL